MLARLFLAASALLLAAGGVMHALAFSSAASAATALPPFFAGSLKLLWLADSVAMLALSAVFAFAAVRQGAAAKPIIAILSLVPIATAMLIYRFVGAFFAAPLLATAGGLALLASLAAPPTLSTKRETQT